MKGNTAVSYALMLLLLAIVALVIAILCVPLQPSAPAPIKAWPEPAPLELQLDTSAATDVVSPLAACSDAFPWAIEPSKHLVAHGVARLSAWAALKFCPALEAYYCPRGSYAGNPGEDHFMVVCRGEGDIYCAVGIISTRVNPAMPGVRTAVTAWIMSCRLFELRRARQGCEPVTSIRFVWR